MSGVDTALMWHVVLQVAGDPVPVPELRQSLERLAHERPFLLTARYAADRAEVRYWDEAERLEDVAALALRLWGEHRSSAGLPTWRVIGLEVLDRESFRQRGSGDVGSALVEAGSVRPF